MTDGWAKLDLKLPLSPSEALLVSRYQQSLASAFLRNTHASLELAGAEYLVPDLLYRILSMNTWCSC